MGRNRTPGLTKRGGTWHIDKQFKGQRICESTGLDTLVAAEEYLRQRLHEISQPKVKARGVRLWREAATKYLLDNKDMASIITESYHLEDLDPFIGNITLNQLHDETLKPFIEHRKAQGRKTKTINLAISLVGRILNLCARKWRDEDGMTWLEVPPMLSLVKPPQGFSDTAKPYPLDWDEQERLIKSLDSHLARMALYKVNTGCREAEVCGLRWQWEWSTNIQELKGRVFIIPGDQELTGRSSVKGRVDRLIVLNDIAKSVVDSQRGVHSTHVFSYKGRPMVRMNNSGWKKGWTRAGLTNSPKYLRGVHNLRHTFGRRLRAAGVTVETRKVLMGHANGDITSHYSSPEIKELLNAVNNLCESQSRKNPALNVVRLTAVN